MKDKIRFVGLDVHKDSITIRVAEEGGESPTSPPRRLADLLLRNQWRSP